MEYVTWKRVWVAAWIITLTFVAGAVFAPAARAQQVPDVIKAVGGDYNKAIKILTTAIDSGKLSGVQLADAYFQRGVAYDLKGNYPQAEADYTNAIRYNRKHTNAIVNRGTIRLQGNRLKEAKEDFDRAITLDKNNTTAYLNRGTYWDLKGNPSKAIKDYTSAINIDSRKAPAYYNRATMFEQIGDYTLALKDAEQALRLDPRKAKYKNYVARLKGLKSQRNQSAQAASSRGTVPVVGLWQITKDTTDDSVEVKRVGNQIQVRVWLPGHPEINIVTTNASWDGRVLRYTTWDKSPGASGDWWCHKELHLTDDNNLVGTSTNKNRTIGETYRRVRPGQSLRVVGPTKTSPPPYNPRNRGCFIGASEEE